MWLLPIRRQRPDVGRRHPKEAPQGVRRLLPAIGVTAEQRPGGGRQSPPAIVLRGGNRTLSLKAHGQAGGQRSGQRVVLVEAGPGCPVQQRYEVTKRLGKVDQNIARVKEQFIQHFISSTYSF